MAKNSSLISALVAGPIVIGQACEFDYSGTQACKALKEEGYRVILVNSNPATIMTDPASADAIYIEPIHWRTLERIIEKIVSNVGRRVDELNPMVDARLEDGSRVNAIIAPLSLDGPSLSIRRFAVDPLGPDDLIATGGTAKAASELVQQCEAEVAAFVFVIHLAALEGTKKLEPHRVISILDY